MTTDNSTLYVPFTYIDMYEICNLIEGLISDLRFLAPVTLNDRLAVGFGFFFNY